MSSEQLNFRQVLNISSITDRPFRRLNYVLLIPCILSTDRLIQTEGSCIFARRRLVTHLDRGWKIRLSPMETSDSNYMSNYASDSLYSHCDVIIYFLWKIALLQKKGIDFKKWVKRRINLKEQLVYAKQASFMFLKFEHGLLHSPEPYFRGKNNKKTTVLRSSASQYFKYTKGCMCLSCVESSSSDPGWVRTNNFSLCLLTFFTVNQSYCL